MGVSQKFEIFPGDILSPNRTTLCTYIPDTWHTVVTVAAGYQGREEGQFCGKRIPGRQGLQKVRCPLRAQLGPTVLLLLAQEAQRLQQFNAKFLT